VRNEVLRKTEERNILHTVKRTKPNWIGYILRGNCFLKRVIEGRIEVTRRRRRRCKELLDELKGAKGYSKLKEELWVAVFGELALKEAVVLS
jgi:hypothetical protein